MTTDPFTEAASEAAEERWTREHTPGHPLSGPERMNRRIGFTMGAKWAASLPPTDTEVEAACAGFYNDPSGLTDWTRLASADQVLADKYRAGMRRALSSARAARRDEEKR